ncbi:hypothetical protein ES702_03300 [subsurface metagenome]
MSRRHDLTVEKHLVESEYDGGHNSQCCGLCGGTEFTDTTLTIKNETVLVTAQCLRCGEINLMHRRSSQ